MRSWFNSKFRSFSINKVNTGNKNNPRKPLTAKAFSPTLNQESTPMSSEQRYLFETHRDKPYDQSGTHFDGPVYLQKCSNFMKNISAKKTNFLKDLKELPCSKFQHKYHTQLSKNPGLKDRVDAYF